ncbi:hypothetical protein ACFPPD_04220 [Cohnella suwonensis]|uniref:Transcriptional regulator n=1 Tax=Cohnella suwonensis TaxID=696072 RepID=A0ABW0LQD4_9BACL
MGTTDEIMQHHHMICLNCEKTLPIRFCPMSETDVPGGFRVVKHKFEVFGYCGTCAEAPAQSSSGRES